MKKRQCTDCLTYHEFVDDIIEAKFLGMWVLVARLENEIDSICAKCMEK